MTKIIENNFDNKAYIRAYLIEGNQDAIAMEFYLSVYPDIRHFESEIDKDLINSIMESIVNTDKDRLLFIETLEVDSHHQGQGVGTEVMNQLIEDTSADFIMLIASPIGDSRYDVDEIVEFYEQFGLTKILSLVNDSGYLMSTE